MAKDKGGSTGSGGSGGSGKGKEARELGKKIIHERKRNEQRKDEFRDKKDEKK